MLLTFLDEDKVNELIVGTSGREVYTYSLGYTKNENGDDVPTLIQKRKFVCPEKVNE